MSLYIKLCGFRTLESLDAAIEAGADGIGLVLADSPRQVSGALAKQLFEHIPAHIERIAVLRRPDAKSLRELRALPWDAIQLDYACNAELPPGIGAKACFLLPSFSDQPDLLNSLKSSCLKPNSTPTSNPSLRGCFVVDGPSGGGMGLEPDPERARSAALLGSMVLSGGLDANNVARALQGIRPYAVDASSGLESGRGIKDPKRIRAFVQAARSAVSPQPSAIQK
jgi:phosphoribosylanthranilate isomerase